MLINSKLIILHSLAHFISKYHVLYLVLILSFNSFHLILILKGLCILANRQ